jgi:cytochrome P450
MSGEDMPHPPVTDSFNHVTSTALPQDYPSEWNRLRSNNRAFGVCPAVSAHQSKPDPDQVTWYLLHYDDISEAFRNYELFSSSNGTYSVPEFPRKPVDVDPPEHTRYRRLLVSLLSPQRLNAVEPRMRELCRDLIGRFLADGECDFVGQFAHHFAPAIFMNILGLPPEEVQEFRHWSAARIAGTAIPSVRIESAQVWVRDYLQSVIDARRTEPRDDLISDLIASRLDGVALGDGELLDLCSGLFGAGLETVATASTWMLRHLAENPHDQQEIRDDVSITPTAVEELLRAYSIIVNERIVMKDVEFAGCPMKKGDRLALPTAAADRDPAAFADPDEVNLRRENNRHLAFGAGPHRCVGAHLARLELRVMLEEWHQRVPEYRIADGATIKQHAGVSAGIDYLPLRWDPQAT